MTQDDWERGAISLLINAASILRIEAGEWRSRGALGKAEADERMAEAMVAHVKALQEAA
jgi:hypothetical protein